MADNTKSSLETAMRYVVDKKLKELQSSSTILLDMTKMKSDDVLGRKFLMPVCLSHSLGITAGDGTVYVLNDAVAATFDEAEIDPTPVTLRERVSQSAANRWRHGSEKSVVNNVALRAGVMKKSISKIAEIEMLYGRSGIATISAVSAVNTSPDPDQITITVTDATWASGIFAGMTGLKLDAYTSGGSQRNTNATLTLVSVDHDAKQIVVSGNNTDLSALAATDILYLRGFKSAGQYGLFYQMDTSGSVFGIDSSVADLWKACEHNVAGALTMPQILKGIAKAVNRGGLDEDVVLLVNPTTFESLNADLAALRETGMEEGSRVEIGHSSIKYRAQSGLVEVMAHPYVKESHGFCFPKSSIRRVGASDIEFVKDDTEGYWKDLAVTGYAGYQCTAQFEFQVFLQEPAKCCLFYGIVNP